MSSETGPQHIYCQEHKRYYYYYHFGGHRENKNLKNLKNISFTIPVRKRQQTLFIGYSYRTIISFSFSIGLFQRVKIAKTRHEKPDFFEDFWSIWRFLKD